MTAATGLPEGLLDEEPGAEAVTGDEARRIKLAVQAFWMLFCTAIGVGFWGSVTGRIDRATGIGHSYLVGAGIVLAINRRTTPGGRSGPTRA